jgi:hypothetical protein
MSLLLPLTACLHNQGYMEALGATQTALVRREAEEGKARNENEARKKVAQYKSEADIASARAIRESHIESNTQLAAQAESDRDLNMKRAEFKRETNKANEEAEAQTRITKAEQDKVVIREVTQQREEEAKVLVNVAIQEVERIKTEASGRSEAELLRQQNEAKGVLVEAQVSSLRPRVVSKLVRPHKLIQIFTNTEYTNADYCLVAFCTRILTARPRPKGSEMWARLRLRLFKRRARRRRKS